MRSGRVALAVWLVVLWVALWGEITAANLLAGVVVAAVVLIAVPAGGADDAHLVTVRPWQALTFLVWLLGQVVLSSVRLAWEVVTPKNSIAMGVVRVPLRSSCDTHVLVVANCVTLTPGTISLDVSGDPAVLDVHVLHLQDPETVVRATLDLERRVVAAFGTRAARDAWSERVRSEERS